MLKLGCLLAEAAQWAVRPPIPGEAECSLRWRSVGTHLARSVGGLRLSFTLLGLAFSAGALERLEPPEGCYFGVNVGEKDSIPRLNARLGLAPAVYVGFFRFPLTPLLRDQLNDFLAQVRSVGGLALVTLEPFQGLTAVTEADGLDLASLCATNEAEGIGGIFIRFAHEMNGNWYPWCQQPMLYREKFRLLAQTVRTNTARTAMLWAPHNGIGYPFSSNGLYQAVRGTADFAALDTNGDGRLTAEDNMYDPYYPGDDVVDWVGMTIYHWGATYPWLENEMPPTNQFAAALMGSGQVPPIPDFYAHYCADGVHDKPLAIPETAAFYNPEQPPGPGEFLIKQAWWRQVFNVSSESSNAGNIAVHLPKLKCISWFDHYKPEAEARNQWIDWRISAHPTVRQAFIEHLRTPWQGRPYFLTASEFGCATRPNCIRAERLPAILPLTGSIQLFLTVMAQTNCDIVADLLDDNFQWKGGTRASVEPGPQSVALDLVLNEPLRDGEAYRWSIFLTPPGRDYLNALAWYSGPGPVARAILPAIEIVGCPPVIFPGEDFRVKVKYTAAGEALAHVNVLDAAHHWHSGATASLNRGDGLVEVTISPQPMLTNGTFMIECFLSDSSSDWQNVMVRSPNCTVRVAPTVERDFVESLPQPSMIPAGEVFRFLATYAAAGDRDLHVDLLDAETNFLAGTAQRVSGGIGVEELTIGHPGAAPGTYLVSAFLTKPGQTWTQALAWSALRPVTVLPVAYLDWVERQWGIVLGSDLILPEQDADGDGASNESERIARTAPLQKDDVLRLSTSLDEGGQLVLSWPSAAACAYRLLVTTDVTASSWTPLDGSVIAGTGDTIQMRVKPSASLARTFYCLEVAVP